MRPFSTIDQVGGLIPLDPVLELGKKRLQLRLLIVEDNEALSENLAEIFEDEGYQVLVAGDGETAIRLSQESGFDVALVDVRLPDMSGTKLAPALTQISPDAEVVIATANADLGSAIEAVQAGAFAYLTKPVRIEELLVTVARAGERIDLRRKSAALQSALEESERRLRTIVENVGALILTIDKDHIIQFASRASEALLGWKPEELIGRDLIDTLPTGSHRQDCARGLGLLRYGGPTTFELDCKHRDGSTRRQQWRWTMSGTNGSASLYGIGSDVSEQRELERRAQTAEKLAAAGTLTAGLAHEIRNPLNAASLQLSVLTRHLKRIEAPERAPADETIELVQAELKRLDVLLEDFLAFARPRALLRDRLELTQLIREVVTLEQPVANEDGCLLSAELTPGIRVDADNSALRQVFLNLIKNALEAAHSEVMVRTFEEAGEAVVLIEDDGPGIPEELHERIFEPFYTTKSGGTGLGMAIAHTIMTNHHGGLSFSPRPGGGTIMRVTLPVV